MWCKRNKMIGCLMSVFSSSTSKQIRSRTGIQGIPYKVVTLHLHQLSQTERSMIVWGSDLAPPDWKQFTLLAELPHPLLNVNSSNEVIIQLYRSIAARWRKHQCVCPTDMLTLSVFIHLLSILFCTLAVLKKSSVWPVAVLRRVLLSPSAPWSVSLPAFQTDHDSWEAWVKDCISHLQCLLWALILNGFHKLLKNL